MAEIFFSYAWASPADNTDNREVIVKQLFDELLRAGYDIVIDKVHLGYRELISDFMRKIGKAEKIIVVISEKYTRSPYCMFELYEIARNSSFEKQVFRERLVPIMYEFVNFAEPAVLKTLLDYWKDEQEKWEALFSSHITQLSEEQFSRYQKVKLVNQHIAMLADWLADMNTLSPVLLRADNFQLIKDALGGSPGKATAAAEKNSSSFKQELADLADASRYHEVFERIKKDTTGIKYSTLLFNRLQQNLAFSVTPDLHNQLKVFIGSIELPNHQ